MPGFRHIVRADDGRPLLRHSRWCDSFAAKLRGFTFRRALGPGESLVLVEGQDSRLATAIHMLFVFFQLGVVWVNDAGEVVDTTIARPWRLSYAPQAPARYVIEAAPDIVDHVRVGDRLRFEPADVPA